MMRMITKPALEIDIQPLLEISFQIILNSGQQRRDYNDSNDNKDSKISMVCSKTAEVLNFSQVTGVCF